MFKNVLLQFIKECIEKKVPKEKIAEYLKKAGWSKTNIRFGLESFDLNSKCPVAVPKDRSSILSSGFIFLTLNIFLVMIFCNFSSIVWSIIDYSFGGLNPSLVFETAMIISSVPIAIFLWIKNEELEKRLDDKQSSIKIILANGASLVLLLIAFGFFASVAYKVLDGSIQASFLLKAIYIMTSTIAFRYFYKKRIEDK